MTREEAILLSAYTGFLLVPDFSEVHKFCEDTLDRPIWTHEFADQDVQKEIQEKLRPQIVELAQNISALRPVSREQVEKVFPGCPYCKPDSEGYVQKFGAYSILNGELKTGHCKPQKISFCPHCSRPLTDEAVEMVMEKINNMEEITNEH